MSELTSLTLAEARDRLRRREFSSVELADAHLVALEKARELNAFVLETPEHALKQAAASDAKLARGEGAIYVGSLIDLTDAGPLFAGRRPPGGSITVHVFATVPRVADLHGHPRTVTLAITLSPR
jgi:hypothetical protein